MKIRIHNVDFPFKLLPLLFSKSIKKLNIQKLINYIFVKKCAKNFDINCKFKPYSATIEPTRMCNLNCKLCLVQQTNSSFKPIFLNFNDFKRFIDANPQFIFIFFAGFGEPTLHPELDRMINYANKKKIITILSTNGTIPIKKTIKPDFVIFSLDYLDRRNYMIHKGKDLFANAIKFIKEYNKTKSFNTITFLQFLINKYNYTMIDKMIKLKKMLHVDFLLLKRPVLHDKKTNKYIIINKNFNITPILNKQFGCKYIYYLYKLTAEGYVSICCEDVLNEGTIKTKDYDSVWFSRAYAKFRKKNAKKKSLISLCKTCPKIKDEITFIDIK